MHPHHFRLATLSLIVLSAFLLLGLAWKQRRSRTPVSLPIGKENKLEAPRWIVFLILGLSLLCFSHLQAQEWAIKVMDHNPESEAARNSYYISEDERLCQSGLRSYNSGYYQEALDKFAEISSLSGPLFVRWKFYEAMALFRLQQHRKVVQLDPVDPGAVEQLCGKLRTIMFEHPTDALNGDAKYWFAQAQRFFLERNEEALTQFRELLRQNEDNPSFRWREGCLYYASMILLDRLEEGDEDEAVQLLAELRGQNAHGVIQPLEALDDGFRRIRTDYTVPAVVDPLVARLGLGDKVEEAIATLSAPPVGG